jgi:hypothetical protein
MRGNHLHTCSSRRAPNLVRWVLALVLLVSGLPHAAAGEPPDLSGTWSHDPIEAEAGQSISVVGECWFFGGQPGSNAHPRLARHFPPGTTGEPMSKSIVLPVAADGSFSGELPIPLWFPAGEYRLSVSCSVADQNWQLGDYEPFTVTAGPFAPPPTTAPATTATSAPTPPPPPPPIPAVPTYTG